MTRPAFFILLSVLAGSPLAPVAAQNVLWTRQFGSSADDFARGVAVDGSGNVYIAGETKGALGGPNAGGFDAFLTKYDSSGTLLWTRQIGTPADDFGVGVALDVLGSVYVAGTTYGVLDGLNAGGGDVFLAQYSAAGALLWTRQIGSASTQICTGVAVTGNGTVCITGYTEGSFGGTTAGGTDAFVAEYSKDGGLYWIRQTGTPANDGSNAVAAAAGVWCITGFTDGNLGGSNEGGADAFLVQYTFAGVVNRTQQIGTSADDYGVGVAVDADQNAYIAGVTYGSLGGPSAGDADAFLTKYLKTGALLWTRQFGTAENDRSLGMAVDRAGNAYITGVTSGSLGGPNAGLGDAFVAKYHASGAPLWTRQLGTSAEDLGKAVVLDEDRHTVYLVGTTGGSLGGPNAGNSDIFLAKYGPPLCPVDVNDDGFVNGDDFDSFSLAFVSGDATADFDGNGVVNGIDFDAYVAAFEAGC